VVFTRSLRDVRGSTISYMAALCADTRAIDVLS